VGIALAGISTSLAITMVARKKNLAATIAIMASILATGVLLASVEGSSMDASRLKLMFEAGMITSQDPVEVTGSLTRPPEPAPQAYFADVDVDSIALASEPRSATGQVRLMLLIADAEAEADFRRLQLDYGSRVRVLVRLDRAPGYKNPGSPDFDEFLDSQGYDLRGTIKSPKLIERAGANEVNPLLALLYGFRLRILNSVDARFAPPVAGTLKAMLVGNRYYLDERSMEQLRRGGTFHVISISGMHVGLIAWLLLGGLSANKHPRRAWVVIVLVVLWLYAVMVGLAPPVTRATVMISAGLVGPLLFRRAVSINTVALAAFVMLALKPSLVADPGFQLSFVAVAGIVALAVPAAERLRLAGEWRPSARTPHPPKCGRPIRLLAETLFWNEREFEREMRVSPIRFRLDKARASKLVGRLRLQGLLRWTVLLVITSAAIQIATLPLSVLYFNRVAPIGLVLNIGAGILTGLLMLSGSLALVIQAMSDWVTSGLESITVAAHYLLVNAISPFDDLPGASFRAAHYEWPASIVYALYFIPFAFLVVAADVWQTVDIVKPRSSVAEARAQQSVDKPNNSDAAQPAVAGLRPSLWSLSAVTMAVALAVVVYRPPPSADGTLRVHFLDVGQGDSLFVVFPRGSTLLVDGGGELQFGAQEGEHAEDGAYRNAGAKTGRGRARSTSFRIGESVVSRFIWSLGHTRVDYALATHAHADHTGGLSDVVKNFSVGELVFGREAPGISDYSELVRESISHEVPLGRISAGQTIEVDGVTVAVLWPPHSNSDLMKENDSSIVLRIVFGSVAVLLTGDIEDETERLLVRSGAELKADVLKVPHHGSKTSSSEPFLDAVSPSAAVISVGERSQFNHPSAVVVERYKARGIAVFQTGRDGTVTLETDGTSVKLRTFRAERGHAIRR
jgi:competence protein ComEC